MVNKIYYNVFEDTDELGKLSFYITKFVDGEEAKKYKQVKKVRNGETRNCLLKLIDENGDLFVCKIKSVEKRKLYENEYILPILLNDEKIIKIEDHFKINGEVFIIYKYIHGPDLLDFLQFDDIDEKFLKLIIKKMAECIKVCHDKSVYHLDIKCENFIVVNSFPLKLVLIDFEFARYKGRMMGRLEGTDWYLAPEIRKYGLYSDKSDIWSLGAVAYSLFTDDHLEYNVLKNGSVSWENRIKQFTDKKCSNSFISFLYKTLNFSERYRFNIDQVLEDPWLN